MRRLGFIFGFLLIATLATYAVLHTTGWFQPGRQPVSPDSSPQPERQIAPPVPAENVMAPLATQATTSTPPPAASTGQPPVTAATPNEAPPTLPQQPERVEFTAKPREPPRAAPVTPGEAEQQPTAPALDTAATAGAASSDLTESIEPQWQPFWGPFNNATSAARFAAELQQRTGIDIRPLETRPGRFMAAFAYRDEQERQANRAAIEEGAGLKIELRQY